MTGLREVWAWVVGAAAFLSGWIADLNNWLLVLGIVVAVLTAIERWYAIRLRKRQIASCAPAQIRVDE